jgi:hypothetical protein
MRVKNLRILVACVLALAFASPALAGGPTKLRYKFKKGQNLKYGMVMDQAMDITTDAAPGFAQKIKMHMDVGMYQKVTGVETGAAVLEVGFTKFDAVMEMGGNKMPIPGSEGFKKMRMSMRMTELGKMDEPKIVNADELDATVKQMAEQMKKSMSQNSLVFPENAIPVGGSWNMDTEIPANLPGAPDLKMKFKSSYKLLGFEKCKGGQCAKIQAKVAVALHGKAESSGVPTQADMDGTGEGVNLFDVNRGIMVKSEAKMTIGGDVTASAQGQKVSSKIKMGIDLNMDLK